MGKRRIKILSRSNSSSTLSSVPQKRKIDERDEDYEDMLDENIDWNQINQQFRIKNSLISVSDGSTIPSCSLVSQSPYSGDRKDRILNTDFLQLSNTFRFKNIFLTPPCQRVSPLPAVSWANSKDVWQSMLKKEELYTRDMQYFQKHSYLQPQMRSILLDWLIEVCEVYRLHRETFYLSVDYIDRYLSAQRDVVKQQLQLIGITAIFIAAKLEEIYPPKLSEFSYVTDGACTEMEIIDQELIMLKVLNWDILPMTVVSWLSVFLQLASSDSQSSKSTDDPIVIPRFSPHTFIQVAMLTDLCMLDSGSLQFSYSVIAVSALYHMSSADIALSVSGYKWQDILSCIQWMAPFASKVREFGSKEGKFFPTVKPHDSHNIQTHDHSLDILTCCQMKAIDMNHQDSPGNSAQVSGILTPPQSSKKDAPDSIYDFECNSPTSS